LGSVDAVYDRAALVALPEALRTRYAAHLMQLTGTAPQLLICFEYDQAALAGPPFSIPDAEVQQHYDRAYALHCLSSSALPGGLKGKCPAMEKVWLLKAR
jgi:thiopurine S-methyltransferase